MFRPHAIRHHKRLCRFVQIFMQGPSFSVELHELTGFEAVLIELLDIYQGKRLLLCRFTLSISVLPIPQH